MFVDAHSGGRNGGVKTAHGNVFVGVMSLTTVIMSIIPSVVLT
jgi:hypothetical protein